jgi:hypothetical protein
MYVIGMSGSVVTNLVLYTTALLLDDTTADI